MSARLIAALWATALVGCGSAAPPSQLVEAREAYANAAEGPPAEVAPVQLAEAREALERAEASFEEAPEEPATENLAYIALRKTERAQARAAAELARRRAEQAREQQEEVEAEYLRRTQRELTITQQQLAEERERLAARNAELEASQEQLEQSSEALERERAAREQAEAAAALESLRQVAQVAEEQRGVVITLSGAVLFRSGSSDLLPIAQQKLDQVAVTLNDHEGRSILIEGHTDSRGSRRTNERLSQERAESVRSYLASQGVEADRMRAQGLGSSRPVADNDTPEGRANNRRVEIVIEPER